MLQSTEQSQISNELSGESIVILFSHDLDDFSLLPLPLKRDFGIKTVRTWFLEDEDGKNKIQAGLRFSEFLGRKVQGYFCDPSALLASGDFRDLVHDDTRKTVIVQLVPDFNWYKGMCGVLGDVLSSREIKARSLGTPDAIAQHLSEHMLLNVIGYAMCLENLRDNPFIPKSRVKDIKQHVRESKLLLQDAELMKFLREVGVNYSFYRLPEGMIGVDSFRSKSSKL